MEQEMMKAAVLTGPKQIEIKNVPVPELEPGMIEIKVSACGVCGRETAGLKKETELCSGQICTVENAICALQDRNSFAVKSTGPITSVLYAMEHMRKNMWERLPMLICWGTTFPMWPQD